MYVCMYVCMYFSLSQSSHRLLIITEPLPSPIYTKFSELKTVTGSAKIQHFE